MSQRLIEFHCPAHLLGRVPHPIAAGLCVPQWMRTIPTHVPTDTQSAEPTPTVKNCMPFLEAMTLGYIIPLPADMTFTMEATELRVDVADITGSDVQLVDVHNGDQLA